MIAIRIAAAVLRAVRPLVDATRKDSAGGKRITPDERDQILVAVVEAVESVIGVTGPRA